MERALTCIILITLIALATGCVNTGPVLLDKTISVDPGKYSPDTIPLHKGDQIRIDLSANGSFNFMLTDNMNYLRYAQSMLEYDYAIWYTDIYENGIVQKSINFTAQDNGTYFIMDNTGKIFGSRPNDKSVSIQIKITRTGTTSPDQVAVQNKSLQRSIMSPLNLSLYGKITINGDVPGGSLRHIQASWLNDSKVDAIGVIEGVTAIMSNDKYSNSYDEVRMCGWIDAQGNYRISDINPGNARYFYIDLFNDNGINNTRIAISPDENTGSTDVHNIKDSTRFDLDLSLRNVNPQGLIVWEYLTDINGSQIPPGSYESLANITRY
jgi:hypothetical protein